MPRKPAFDAASLYVHFQPTMVCAFPVLNGLPRPMQDLLEQLARPMDLSIGARLRGLKRLFDEEAPRVSAQAL